MNVILQHPKIEHYLFTKMPKPNTDNGYRAQPIMIKLWLFFSTHNPLNCTPHKIYLQYQQTSCILYKIKQIHMRFRLHRIA